MGKSSKRLRKPEESESGSDDDGYMQEESLNVEDEKDDYGDEDSDTKEGDDYDDGESDAEEEDEEQDDIGYTQNDGRKDAEMEELEKEYMNLRHNEEDVLKNLRRHKDEDLLKGQAVKNQRALWDKTLEFRVLLQKAFSSSNRLPQEPVRSLFCGAGDGVNEAYSDLITSTKETLNSILELQEAIVEKNPSITQAADGSHGNLAPSSKTPEVSKNLNEEGDEGWLQISQMHSRIASFRDKSIDKWHRKTQVTTGAAAIKGKLQAFGQSISEQVAYYMRDPSKTIKVMQQRSAAVATFGSELNSIRNGEHEVTNVDGDPELLDDSEFYQQLLKEFIETFDPESSEAALYALKRMRTKKRKSVDRCASKSRKIRYNVHEKIVNIMAPQHFEIPSMASTLFEDLFGLKSQRTTTSTA